MRAPPGGGGGNALPVFLLTIIGLGLAPGFSTFFVKSSGVRPILRPFVFAIDVEGNSIGVQYLVPVRYYLVAPPPRAAGPSRARAGTLPRRMAGPWPTFEDPGRPGVAVRGLRAFWGLLGATASRPGQRGR